MPHLPIVEREIEQVRATLVATARELSAVRTLLVDTSGVGVVGEAGEDILTRATSAATAEASTLVSISEDCARAAGRHVSQPSTGGDGE